MDTFDIMKRDSCHQLGLGIVGVQEQKSKSGGRGRQEKFLENSTIVKQPDGEQSGLNTQQRENEQRPRAMKQYNEWKYSQCLLWLECEDQRMEGYEKSLEKYGSSFTVEELGFENKQCRCYLKDIAEIVQM